MWQTDRRRVVLSVFRDHMPTPRVTVTDDSDMTADQQMTLQLQNAVNEYCPGSKMILVHVCFIPKQRNLTLLGHLLLYILGHPMCSLVTTTPANGVRQYKLKVNRDTDMIVLCTALQLNGCSSVLVDDIVAP